MPTSRFHGVRVTQNPNELVVARPIDTSVIGLLMAVDPTGLPTGILVNAPFAVRYPTDAALLPAAVNQELDTIWDNGGSTVVVTLVDQGTTSTEKVANAVGDATIKTGVHAFTTVTSRGLPKPKILVMPGYKTTTGTANGAIAEAAVVAEQMRAQLYVDGPGTTLEDAKLSVGLIANKRVCVSDGPILKSVGGVPTAHSSAVAFAAIQSKLDRERNVAWPHTNVLINGIVGTAMPVLYGTEATELNEAGVNTIINRGDGFRTWGPMTTVPQTIWEFVNVVRTTDFVNETIETAFIQYIGRPMIKDNLDLMAMTGRGLLKVLEAENILLKGSRFGLASNNSPEEGVQGIVKFGMAFEVPAPIYDARITAYRNITVAYTALFNSVTGQFEVDEIPA